MISAGVRRKRMEKWRLRSPIFNFKNFKRKYHLLRDVEFSYLLRMTACGRTYVEKRCFEVFITILPTIYDVSNPNFFHQNSILEELLCCASVNWFSPYPKYVSNQFPRKPRTSLKHEVLAYWIKAYKGFRFETACADCACCPLTKSGMLYVASKLKFCIAPSTCVMTTQRALSFLFPWYSYRNNTVWRKAKF